MCSFKYKEIVESKRTGRRFIVTSTSVDTSGSYPKIKVIPEGDYQDYVNAKHYDHYFGHVWEGVSPWLVPVRDLKSTGKVYRTIKSDKTIDHWSTMSWEDDGGTHAH